MRSLSARTGQQNTMTTTDTSSTGGHAADLERAVTVNEEIKRIVVTSSEVRLAAINAMLTAKRAGGRSLGFAVVSSELRVFSGQLDGFMQALAALIYGLIQRVAQVLKQARVLRALHMTMDQSDRACELLAALARRSREHIQRTSQDIVQEWAALSLQLERAQRLCGTGVALSRSAKIEAAHGGDMAPTLRQVAEQIEETVGSMLAILRSLTAQVQQ